MIPKVIHYCWFGGNPLPELAVKCIESWKKFFPDYKIIEWNENNWDIHCCDYVREAYEEKKWAFVADYARFDIIYKNGGLYFDTDVEVIASMDDIIEQGPFLGLEEGKIQSFMEATNNRGQINPGLGMGAPAGLQLYKEILDRYQTRHFKCGNNIDLTTVVQFVTDIIAAHGVSIKNELGYCEEIAIYPVDYFCPMEYVTGEINITSNTRTIHHYTASWISPTVKKIIRWKNICKTKYGRILGSMIAFIITLPLKIKNKFEQVKK